MYPANERFGGMGALINDAGVIPLAPRAASKTGDRNRMIDVNVRGELQGIAAVFPRFVA